ncbi:type I restriction system specificity protein [Capnocytophaga cynodegmi]|uniref:restriction endonuclease subunit S n=1 Tax=Capnocytophaga cynodegmi TaxID=28189 RepID=UPI001EE24A8F|nr:restriction endonuclease subunit S [Capnocytophaga cynodegmi]GJQ06334.1 type I restriction system specificity protein [Capnocytophaga cynodegmi]
MNRIENLLQGQKVEWKTLGEVCVINKGKQLNKTELKEEGKYPAYNGGKTYSGFTDKYNVEENITIISQGGASAGFVNFITTKFWANAHCYYVIPNIDFVNNRYLFHFLKWQEFYLMEAQHGAGIPALAISKLSKLQIPIPPLSVQKEIANILDTFTTLEAELEAELDCRLRQYRHYRDTLLTFGDDVEWKTLGEVCEYVDYRGKTPKKVESGIYLVTAKNIKKGFIDYEVSKEYISENDYDEVMRRGLPKIGDVLITTEAPCGNVAQVDNENIALAQRVIKYCSRDVTYLSNDFLKHYLLCNDFQNLLFNSATGGTVKGIKGSVLHKLQIPIPPIEEQRRIVNILDKFDTLTNSITEGLPKEIELRRKQYEYYREKLLSFPEN